MNNEPTSAPNAIATAAAKAMSGGATANKYIETTQKSARGSEKFMNRDLLTEVRHFR